MTRPQYAARKPRPLNYSEKELMKTDEEKMKEVFCALTAILIWSRPETQSEGFAYDCAETLWTEHRKRFAPEPEK